MSTEGKTITCKAAIAWEAAKPLCVEEVQVAPPKEDEVRIKILYTGICHTDAFTLSGNDPEGDFPVILGHEGGGIVESVGKGVDNVKVGDHVIPLYTAGEVVGALEITEMLRMVQNAGIVNFASRERRIFAEEGKGVMPDGTTRFRCKGKDILHFMGTSTFSQYTVVSKFSVVAINERAPLEKACLLGCGITTGYGAATKSPGIEDSNVAVFGIGCVGLSILQGCRAKKCKRVFAIDTNSAKADWAKKFGATDFVNPKDLPKGKSIVDHLVAETEGGLDFTFDATGNVGVMRNALEACHKGWDRKFLTGYDAGLSLMPIRFSFQLVTGRTWKGSAFGGVKGRTEIPGIVEDYLNGTLWVDEFVSHHQDLDNINKGFEDMHAGDCIRCVVNMGFPKSDEQ
ncbi:MAG: formate dehydrogenase (NAD+) [Tremellales sp. Tagirdzhanova-0007]|nr:MAG: formate dehydrogenase (NAD+) [Tremellales sp. Tagirdzhanova-0007]